MNWKHEALKREKNLIGDLQQLIAIPSVLDEKCGNRGCTIRTRTETCT